MILPHTLFDNSEKFFDKKKKILFIFTNPRFNGGRDSI